MKHNIDPDKFITLATKFAEHERWIQGGCSEGKEPSDPMPAFLALASQDPKAYGLYRDYMLLYLADLNGYGDFFNQFLKLITECESKYPAEMALFWKAHENPTEKFREQWRNLFDPFTTSSLTHQNCYKYQQKYEVEFVLIVLAQLRQINSGKSFDASLDRFCDNKGKFKKGVIANYIIDGFQKSPKIKNILNSAYDPKLRNIIGHNEYKICNDAIKSLDGKYTVKEHQFFYSYRCLQEVHNAILWLFSHDRSPNKKIAYCGVPSIGFDLDMSGTKLPNLIVYQINTFRQLDPEAEWLKEVVFSIDNGIITTSVSLSDKHYCKYTENLEAFIKYAIKAGKINVNLYPIMPCVHKEDHAIKTDWGEFCLYGSFQNIVVPVVVKGI
jgi:hypothetical protein